MLEVVNRNDDVNHSEMKSEADLWRRCVEGEIGYGRLGVKDGWNAMS